MKTVKFVFLKPEEVETLENDYDRSAELRKKFGECPHCNRNLSSIFPIQKDKLEFIKENRNKTLNYIKLLSNKIEWKDYEELQDFIRILREIREADKIGRTEYRFEDADVKLILRHAKSIIKNKDKFKGIPIEEYFDFVSSFENAESIDKNKK